MLNSYNCATGRGIAAVANAVQATESNGKTKADMNAWTGLSNDQWSALLSMLNSHNKNHEKLTGNVLGIRWIVDTGASHHMSGDAQLLNDLCDVPPYLVSLPNGSTTVALKMGTVILTNNMKLHHVFYIPRLKCNLIYVYKLTIENNYLVIFSDKLCVIQD